MFWSYLQITMPSLSFRKRKRGHCLWSKITWLYRVLKLPYYHQPNRPSIHVPCFQHYSSVLVIVECRCLLRAEKCVVPDHQLIDHNWGISSKHKVKGVIRYIRPRITQNNLSASIVICNDTSTTSKCNCIHTIIVDLFTKRSNDVTIVWANLFSS